MRLFRDRFLRVTLLLISCHIFLVSNPYLRNKYTRTQIKRLAIGIIDSRVRHGCAYRKNTAQYKRDKCTPDLRFVLRVWHKYSSILLKKSNYWLRLNSARTNTTHFCLKSRIFRAMKNSLIYDWFMINMIRWFTHLCFCARV